MGDVEYRAVPGFPGYRVGDDGTVWSCLRRVGLGIGGGCRIVLGERWRRLKARTAPDGYPYVQLRRRNYRKIHRLVLEAFVGPAPAGHIACHADGSKRNNRLTNLRWDTPSANDRDRERHGVDTSNERNGRASITNLQVRAIRLLHRQMRAVDIAECFNLSPSYVRAVATGRVRRLRG